MTRRAGLILAVGLTALSAAGAAANELVRSRHAVGATQPYAAPAIVLRTPQDGGVYASPLGIDIGFEPARDAEIDLSTLKVTVVTHTLIGDLTFDITDDVSPFASPGGIQTREARIPPGEHTVTISVADTQQRQAEQRLTIIVRGERARAD